MGARNVPGRPAHGGASGGNGPPAAIRDRLPRQTPETTAGAQGTAGQTTHRGKAGVAAGTTRRTPRRRPRRATTAGRGIGYGIVDHPSQREEPWALVPWPGVGRAERPPAAKRTPERGPGADGESDIAPPGKGPAAPRPGPTAAGTGGGRMETESIAPTPAAAPAAGPGAREAELGPGTAPGPTDPGKRGEAAPPSRIATDKCYGATAARLADGSTGASPAAVLERPRAEEGRAGKGDESRGEAIPRGDRPPAADPRPTCKVESEVELPTVRLRNRGELGCSTPIGTNDKPGNSTDRLESLASSSVWSCVLCVGRGAAGANAAPVTRPTPPAAATAVP